MSFRAGRPLRIELYGLALAGVVVVLRLSDRSRVNEEIVREVVRHLANPVVIQQQHNHQSVIIESESDRLARELAIKRGWIDVNRRANGTNDSNGGRNDVPADQGRAEQAEK